MHTGGSQMRAEGDLRTLSSPPPSQNPESLCGLSPRTHEHARMPKGMTRSEVGACLLPAGLAQALSDRPISFKATETSRTAATVLLPRHLSCSVIVATGFGSNRPSSPSTEGARVKPQASRGHL